MMKKLVNIVVLFSIMLFPSLVNAYELNCGNGPYSYDDSFICTVTGAGNINYDIMKGTFENNENVSCMLSSIADGMTSKGTLEVSNTFDLSGRSSTDDIVSFKCQVIGKLNDNISEQLFINDFTYHDSTNQSSEQTEILRSNNFTIKKYDEETQKPTDTKPRDTSNSNSRLKGVSSKGLDFTFSSFITEYNIDVLYEVEQLDLMILPFNLEATYRVVGSQKLEVGDNVIDIYVTSPDGKATTCYTFYIKRLPRGEEIYYAEADATLKDLIISGQNIKFDKNTTDYTINIGYDVDSVDINAVPTVDGANVEVVNATGLKNGDVISINVVSTNGTSSKKYMIKVIKAAAPYDYSKIIKLGVIGLGFLVLLIMVIRSSRKSKEDPLLSIKNDKRKINKGENFDANAVPDATPNGGTPAPNVINANTASVVTPMMIDPNAVDDNRNKITTNVNTLNLNSTALPTQLPAGTVPNQPQMPNNMNQMPSMDVPEEQASPVNTLDLSGVATPMNPSPTQVPVQPIQQVPNQVSPVQSQPVVTSLDQVQSVSIPVPPNNNMNNQ